MNEAPLSEQEALIYTMVAMSAADGTMSDAELKTIGDVVQTAPVFDGFNTELLVPIAEICAEKLNHEHGMDIVMEEIATSLPERLHPTAYAFAIEVAAADLFADQEELAFLQAFRRRIDLDKLSVAAIEHSARVRYRKLV